MMDSLKYRLGAIERRILEMRRPNLVYDKSYRMWIKDLGEVVATFESRNHFGCPIFSYRCVDTIEVGGRTGLLEGEYGKEWRIIEELETV